MKNNSKILFVFYSAFLLILISCKDKPSVSNKTVRSSDSSKVEHIVKPDKEEDRQ